MKIEETKEALKTGGKFKYRKSFPKYSSYMLLLYHLPPSAAQDNVPKKVIFVFVIVFVFPITFVFVLPVVFALQIQIQAAA